MKHDHILGQFYHGINWNALSFILHKIISTSVSFLLFMRMSTQDFSTWANLNSLIFLTLLWLDFGLRKSLPRFCPIFSQTRQSHRKFIGIILSAQTTLLIISTPIFYYLIANLITTLHLTPSTYIPKIALYIFIMEGIVAVLRLLYHSHSHQKTFNSTQSLLLIIESCIISITIALAHSSDQILTALLISKAISSTVLVSYYLFTLDTIYYTTYSPHYGSHNYRTFLTHTGNMWFNTTLKSLSERNFLIPFLTYTLGQHQANIGKIAIESALIFNRAIAKTIGTSDTTLLTHAISNDPALLPQAFKHLMTTIYWMCLPLLISALLFIAITPSNNLLIGQVFLIIVIGYLIEAILSPFERILEVHHHYTQLLIAYIPYIITIIFLYMSITSLKLIGFITCIQAARLTGSLLMAYFARKKYSLPLDLLSIKIIYSTWKLSK